MATDHFLKPLLEAAGPMWIWALGLALGFPVALLLLNEAAQRLARRGHPLVPVVRSVRLWLAPSAAVVLFLRGLAGLPADATLNRIALTVFLTVLLWVGLRLFDHALFGAAAKASWRGNVPSLFRDIARSLMVGLGAAVVYSEVWGKDFAGAFAALGLGSLVIGLALQEPLGNVFSDIMLLFERPLKLGEWITVDNRTGKVTEMNWRAVSMETRTRETIVVPNSALYKTAFSNLSRPTEVRTELLELGFAYDDPPAKVKAVLLGLLKTTPGILADPAPVVRTAAYKDFSILYEVEFSVRHPGALPDVKSELLSRLWYVVRRERLTIPYPIATEIAADQKDWERRSAVDPLELLRQFPEFQRREGDSGEVRVLSFTAGELMMTEGDELDGLCLIARGSATISAKNAAGRSVEIARIGPGDFFGEHSLLAGQESPFEVQALGDVDIVLFDLVSARSLVEASPRLARRVGETIDQRQRLVQLARRNRAES